MKQASGWALRTAARTWDSELPEANPIRCSPSFIKEYLSPGPLLNCLALSR